MIKIRKIIAEEGGRFAFFCPGCKCGHWFNATTWTYNGDAENPTISPSILVTGTKLPNPIPLEENGKYKLGADGRIEGCKDTRCHSFVADGRIQFLSDCTHELAGQTVELPEF